MAGAVNGERAKCRDEGHTSRLFYRVAPTAVSARTPSANITMVHDRVWEQAWAGRRKPHHSKVPGQEILCIGCLEAPPRPQAHAQRLHQRTDQRSRPSSHVRALARTPDEEGASRVTLSG
jgi:hypothetical protein